MVPVPETFASSKIPPAWDPAWQRQYPFRRWIRDITWWALATDVSEGQQAAAVILRLQGTARELCSEFDPAEAQFGRDIDDGMGGSRRINGLSALLRGLARQFAPLDGEGLVRSIAELMSFRVNPGEDIDSVLSRFQLLRSRAVNDAGMDPGPTGYAWMLMTGLQIPPDEWNALLQPLQGRLPLNDDEFNSLLSYIRRRGHLFRSDGVMRAAQSATHGQAMQNSHQQNIHGRSSHHRNQFPGHFMMHNMDMNSPYANDTLPNAMYQQFDQMPPPGGYAAPPAPYQHVHPQTTFGSELNAAQHAYAAYDQPPSMIATSDSASVSSATSSSQEGDLPECMTYLTGFNPEDHGEVLYNDYLLARRRWRTFTGKKPRFQRRKERHGNRSSHFDKKRGGHKGGSGLFGRSRSYQTSPHHNVPACYNPYQQSSFPAGAAAPFKRKNPTGKDGKVLTCHNCGADDHMRRECPNPPKQGGGAPGKRHMFTEDASQSSGLDAHISLFTQSAPQRSRRNETRTCISLGDILPVPPVPSSSTQHAFHGTEIPAPKARFPPPPHTSASASAQSSDISFALSPYMSSVKPATSAQLFFPTFHELKPDHARRDQIRETSARLHLEPGIHQHDVYMSLARLHEGGEALLVDPGAHDNLVGSEWVRRTERILAQYGIDVVRSDMSRPAIVGGVGKGVETCAQQAAVPIMLPGGVTATYNAPIVPNSSTPALLGNKTLKRNRAIIDCATGVLMFCGPGDVKIDAPPGTSVMQMQFSDSGHWMLPCTEYAKSSQEGQQL